MLDCTFVYRPLTGFTLKMPTACPALRSISAKPLAHTLQVDAIVSTAEPYAQSARKRARRLSVAAGDFARRSMGGTGSKFHAR